MEHLLLEFGNSCDLGQTHYKEGFLNRLYLPYVDVQYPDYKVTDELEKDGVEKEHTKYRMVEKIYTVKCLVPEYILDSITTLPLCDTVYFYAIDGRVYKAVNISIESEWTDNNYLADTSIKFTVDNIVQNYCCNNMQVDCYDNHPALIVTQTGELTYYLTPDDFPPNAFAEIVTNNGNEYQILGTFPTNSFSGVQFVNDRYDLLRVYPRVYNWSCSYTVTQTSFSYTDYIQNGGFETLQDSYFASWNEYPYAGTIEPNHSDAYSGYYCCKMVMGAAGVSPFILQNVTAGGAGTYRLEFWYKLTGSQINFKIFRGNPPYEYLQDNLTWGAANNSFNILDDVLVWTLYSLNFTSNADVLHIYFTINTNATAFFDNVKLYKIA